MSEAEAVERLQALLARLEATLGELESSDDSDAAVERLGEMADLAREVQAEIDRARREGPDATS